MFPRTLATVVLAAFVLTLLTGCLPEKGALVTEQYVYTVKQGDAGLRDVAAKVYGDASAEHVALIHKANPTAKADALQPGTKLVIPPLVTDKGAVTYPKECDRKPVY